MFSENARVQLKSNCVSVLRIPFKILKETDRKPKIMSEFLFCKNNGTFEFTRHISVVQGPSSVESRINLKLHLNLLCNAEQR